MRGLEDRSFLNVYGNLAGRVAQMARAPPLQGGGRRFKSVRAHQKNPSSDNGNLEAPAQVIVLVGQDSPRFRFERLGQRGGSSPRLEDLM